MAPEADWNLEMVRSREARRLLPKLPGTRAVDWGDIRVAHLDTGFTRHPAFGFRPGETPWLLPGDGLNLLAVGEPRDTLDYDGNPGHGTRTCSILCGEAVPLPGEGAIGSEVGVAPRLPVVPCRIVRSVVLLGEDNRRAVADGIRHAVAKGCQVVSISLGIPTFAPWAKGGMGLAVDEAYEAGVIVVAAGGQFIDSLCYPAKFNRTIGVGGVTHEREDLVRLPRRQPVARRVGAGQGRAAGRQPGAGGGRDPAAGRGRRPRLVQPERESDSGSLSPHSGRSGKGDGTSYATVHVAAAAAMWLRARDGDVAGSTASRGSGSRRSAACCARPPGGSRASSRRTVTPASSTSRPCLRLTSRRGRAREGRGGQEQGRLILLCQKHTLSLRGMSDPITTSEQRLQEYLSRLTAVLGDADRKARDCRRLLHGPAAAGRAQERRADGGASRSGPGAQLHQALHHFVATAAWRDEAVLAAVREQVLPGLPPVEWRGEIRASCGCDAW